MKDSMCPQCGAPLKPVMLGAFKDKVLQCEHCGYVRDVPDQSVTEQTFEYKPIRDADGNWVSRKSKVVISRRDEAEDLPPLRDPLKDFPLPDRIPIVDLTGRGYSAEQLAEFLERDFGKMLPDDVLRAVKAGLAERKDDPSESRVVAITDLTVRPGNVQADLVKDLMRERSNSGSLMGGDVRIRLVRGGPKLEAVLILVISIVITIAGTIALTKFLPQIFP